MADLLPCPFCGCAPVENGESGFVKCRNDKCCIGGGTRWTAFHIWNHRAPAAPSPAAGEAVSDIHVTHAVNAVLLDLRDRRGLKQAWDQIDLGTREEIIHSWHKAIASKVSAAPPAATAGYVLVPVEKVREWLEEPDELSWHGEALVCAADPATSTERR